MHWIWVELYLFWWIVGWDRVERWRRRGKGNRWSWRRRGRDFVKGDKSNLLLDFNRFALNRSLFWYFVGWERTDRVVDRRRRRGKFATGLSFNQSLRSSLRDFKSETGKIDFFNLRWKDFQFETQKISYLWWIRIFWLTWIFERHFEPREKIFLHK